MRKCGKNVLERDRPQMIIWRMRIACWMPKAAKHTHTHRLCNTHCFSTTTMVARTHLSVMLYVHCLSCSLLSLLSRGHSFASCREWSRRRHPTWRVPSIHLLTEKRTVAADESWLCSLEFWLEVHNMAPHKRIAL